MTGSDGAPRERSVAEIRSERFLLFGLATSGVASEALYLRLVRFNAIDGLRPVVTFVGFMMVLFAIYGLAFLLLRKIQLRAKAALAITALGAVLFRITMIPAGLPPDASIAEMRQLVREDLHGTSVGFDRFLLYDDDIWRYLWDGHVWANSVNPFRFAPTDARLDYLAGSASSSGSDEASPWQDIRDNINHAQVPTIYPPLAQLFFRLSHVLAPGSVIVLKTILVSFDLLTMLLVYLVLRKLGSHPAWLLLYAWNPLLIKVVAGSGHIDVLAATLLALTAYLLQKRAHLPAALALAGAALVKVAPLALLPFLAKRIGWKKSLAIPMVVLLAYVPFRGAGWSVFTGLARYAQGWQFNSAFFLVIQSLARPFAKDPAMVARAIGMSAFSATAIWFWWHDDGEPSSFSHFGAYTLAALILFSPTVMPWYVVWLLPMSAISQVRIWFWLTALVCLSFFVMVDGRQRVSVLAIEYGALLVIALWSAWRERQRHRSPVPEERELQTCPSDLAVATTVANQSSK